MKYYLAIDIGASSGRHIIGYRTENGIETDEIYRFYNGMDNLDGHLVWDTERLFKEIKTGIKLCFDKYKNIESLSIDTWSVDYVLMQGEEEVYPVYAYRDKRMDEVIDKVHEIVPFAELYSRMGTEFNKFNTVYQFYADKIAVDEETVRLRSHISQLETLLNGGGAIGRKLDFLLQEMNRETNTIGSKGNDIEQARTVVEIKSQLEKIREQIQNIE
jgi:hypothetical protein